MAERTQRFREARRDPALAVLEGFHALKHALRFGAEVVEVAVAEGAEVERLADELAPDVRAAVAAAARVPAAEFEALAPRPPETGVLAIARRPEVTAADVLAADGPVVLLEDPRSLANLGACVRVAAAAGAGGVLTTGSSDPWHPDALRGAAGLHYALPVARAGAHLEHGGRALVAVDPSGDDLDPRRLPPAPLLAFGGERHGLSGDLLARADAVVGIPMRPGVSSLNLATSVAAVLYAWRFAAR